MMEGNISSGSSMQGQGNGCYGGFDFQGPMHRPLRIGNPQECDQTVSLTVYNKQDRGRLGSDEDEADDGGGKKGSPWQRVKWTDMMVRLLITAVSYITEEVGGGSRRARLSNSQKKGKWKSVSKAMAERGEFVSPQQCEDKFNDLNKRYKRLNEILGRGTCCEVVENPALLDAMDLVSEKAKEEVRKILSSKHLHYEEMCSYHNGNRLHLPPDPQLQQSLHLALVPRDDHDHDHNDVEEESEFDDHDGFEDNRLVTKRVKQCQGHQDFGFKNSLNLLDCNRAFNIQAEKPIMNNRNLQLEEKRLHIQAQTLELEKERLKWERFCQKQDRELEMMKMEIESMRLENERMALELKQKEMSIQNN